MVRTIKLIFLLLFISAISQAFESKFSPTEVKRRVNFIFSFSDQVAWKNLGNLNEFKIGILSHQEGVYEELAKSSTGRRIKGLPYRILYFQDLKDIEDVQILYFNAEETYAPLEVFNKITGKNILLITENMESFKFTMINFIQDREALVFSVNERQMELEGLLPSSKLLEYGHVKTAEWEDAFTHFKEMEKVNVPSFELTKREMEQILKEHLTQIEKIEIQRKEIANQLSKIISKEEEIKLQQKNLELLKEENRIQEEDLRLREIEQREIGHQMIFKQMILQAQQLMIEDQTEKITTQKSTLLKQKVAIIIVVVFAIVALFLLYITFRENKLKQAAYKRLSLQNEMISKQKLIIEEHNKEITDSLHYAHRIQQAVLPDIDQFKRVLPNHFVFLRQREIVGGDFYWVSEQNNKIFFATVDCTGHGVPGGFMTMLGSTFLSEFITDLHYNEPAEILDALRAKLIRSLKQTENSSASKDGMDMVLCCIDKSNMMLSYAAANNTFYLIRNGKLIESNSDKQPIGYYGDSQKPFKQYSIQLQTGDMIYTYTDGYADQFGGRSGKKFKYSQLEELLINIHSQPLKDQSVLIENRFDEWKSDYDQLDDVLITGIKI